MDYTEKINNHTLEYFDNTHSYIVDGVVVPSITQILKVKFGHMYDNVNKALLYRAAIQGTAVHDAIERYCKTGEDDGSKEVRNFKFLQWQYNFKVVENEVPVILSVLDIPIAAGRLDMVIEIDGKIGGADIKRTASINKDYLAYQLNLYRIAYRQCYGVEWEFLKGIHLREDKRKFFNIPIAEDLAWKLVHEYWRENNE